MVKEPDAKKIQRSEFTGPGTVIVVEVVQEWSTESNAETVHTPDFSWL